ncbi:MAG: alpha/beta hydrolase fold domain-containing protein [Bacteroidota bacterium]
MKNTLAFLLSFIFCSAFGQNFQQPAIGPGSAIYQYDSVQFYNYADQQDGFWLFEPNSLTPQTTDLVVFLHGYGGYNPMIYGQWIKHLVRKGNTVIYPRYQKNVFSPNPDKFSPNVVTGIKTALQTIRESDRHIPTNEETLCIVGHSYGGILAAEITANWEKYKIPQPKGIFLCAPGTGPFKAGKLDSYEALPANLKLLVMVNEKDFIVGDEMGMKIFETAVNTPDRNLIRQKRDEDNGISAGHNETYCVDETFDSGHHNYTAKKALRITRTNAIDYYGYWKLFDALIDCSRNDQNCEHAFGNTPEQRNLGLEGGIELEVITPPTLLSEKQ